MIPSILKINIQRSNKKRVNLWLPIFLLWPFLLILALVLFPILLIVQIGRSLLGQKSKAALILPYLYDLLSAFQGLHIEVSGKENVRIVFI